MAKLFIRKHSIDIHGGAVRIRSNVHQQVTHQTSAPFPSNQPDMYNDLVFFIESLTAIFREKFDHQQCHAIAVITFTKVFEFYTQFMTAVRHCDSVNVHQSRTISKIKCIVSALLIVVIFLIITFF